MAVCPQCKRENPLVTSYCPACGAPMTEEGVQRQQIARQNAQNVGLMGMKWYKFLMYFSLPVSILMNAFGLYDSIRSLQDFNPADYYESLAQLVRVELIGAVLLGTLVIVLAAVAEWGLVKRRWAGVQALLGSYLLNGLFALVMAVLVYTADVPSGGYEAIVVTSLGTQYISNLAAAAVMFFLNRTYFTKRKALFLPDEGENRPSF